MSVNKEMFAGFQSKICVQVATGSDNNNSLCPASKVSNHNIWFFATCKRIQDSLGFRTPRRGFRIPSTGFWILCQGNLDPRFQLLVGFWIPYAGFRFPEPRIPDFTSKSLQIPDSSSKKVSRFPSYTVQNASENDRKTDNACEAGSWLSLLNSLLLIKCAIIRNLFLNSHFTRHGCD